MRLVQPVIPTRPAPRPHPCPGPEPVCFLLFLMQSLGTPWGLHVGPCLQEQVWRAEPSGTSVCSAPGVPLSGPQRTELGLEGTPRRALTLSCF